MVLNLADITWTAGDDIVATNDTVTVLGTADTLAGNDVITGGRITVFSGSSLDTSKGDDTIEVSGASSGLAAVFPAGLTNDGTIIPAVAMTP